MCSRVCGKRHVKATGQGTALVKKEHEMPQQEYRPGIYVVQSHEQEIILQKCGEAGHWTFFGTDSMHFEPWGKILAGPFTPEQIAAWAKVSSGAGEPGLSVPEEKAQKETGDDTRAQDQQG